jgi:ribosomal protein L35
MAKVKNKTHKGLSKVSKKHGNGKIQLTTAGGSHKSGKKSRKTVRKYAKNDNMLNKSDNKRLKSILGK